MTPYADGDSQATHASGSGPSGVSLDEDEAEKEALEDTLGDLVIEALHLLLSPGSTLLLATVPNSEQINDALSVSLPQL